MDGDQALRAQLARALAWHEAHVDFDTVTVGIPDDLRGAQPPGLPFSPWQLLEHLRITQHDILEFSRNPAYEEMRWPDDYWPRAPAPPNAGAWDRSVAAYREDRARLEALAMDPAIDLFATIPHGSGQTYLRELLLAVDHASYHVGQLVAVRRLLGVWPSA